MDEGLELYKEWLHKCSSYSMIEKLKKMPKENVKKLTNYIAVYLYGRGLNECEKYIFCMKDALERKGLAGCWNSHGSSPARTFIYIVEDCYLDRNVHHQHYYLSEPDIRIAFDLTMHKILADLDMLS